MDKQTEQAERKKQNARRCKSSKHCSKFKARIKIYDYGFVTFGEPAKARLETLPFYEKVLATYRFDYDEFLFVRCEVKGKLKILVIRFESNGTDRSHCKLLETWDPDHVITSIITRSK